MEKKVDFWFGVYWGHSFLSLLIVLWSLIVLVVFFVLAFINEREWNFFLACWWIPMVALFTDMVPLLMVGLERGWSVWWCYSVVWTTFVKHHFSLVTRWGSLHDSVFWEQPEIMIYGDIFQENLCLEVWNSSWEEDSFLVHTGQRLLWRTWCSKSTFFI